MADIRGYIKSHLMSPLKQYPTVIQDTMIEIITDKLEELYLYSIKFPEIVSPDQSRLDILDAITKQFSFSIRGEADLQEQLNILSHILYVYNRRGSIDTIENMWKYYGGSLPKDVKVIIPSYSLFRYSVSALSGTHKFVKGKFNTVTLDTPSPLYIESNSLVHVVGTNRSIITTGVSEGSYTVPLSNITGLAIGDRLNIAGEYEGNIVDLSEDAMRQDRSINRSGVYEIRLTNNTYPIPDLREFLIRELVAAGNEIYFTNSLHMEISDNSVDTNPYRYKILQDNLVQIQLSALKSNQGFTWSGHNALSSDIVSSLLSGRSSIYLELTRLYDPIQLDDFYNSYKTYHSLGFYIQHISSISEVRYYISANYKKISVTLNQYLYCTPTSNTVSVIRHLYNTSGELVTSPYPGYFVLSSSLLGEVLV